MRGRESSRRLLRRSSQEPQQRRLYAFLGGLLRSRPEDFRAYVMAIELAISEPFDGQCVLGRYAASSEPIGHRARPFQAESRSGFRWTAEMLDDRHDVGLGIHGRESYTSHVGDVNMLRVNFITREV
jgi:hypothetical protein